MVASTQMKIASEARLRSVFPLEIQSRLVCHYLDTLWTLRVGSLKYKNSRMKFASEARLNQLFLFATRSRLVSIPLSRHFTGVGGRVLAHQTERFQLNLTYNASW